MIDRRAFLRRLGFGTVAAAAAATGVLDIEKLLWIPGEKTIFIPRIYAPQNFSAGNCVYVVCENGLWRLTSSGGVTLA